ncbi:MAG: fasciclin domain-containing protein, partial [Bacteroidaceae bacterium]|nr:fasciclin domain-containing protein [Bacteroidaceae bacterium]
MKKTRIFSISLLVFMFVASSCVEDIDKSNRYTFTSETMADYLENRPEEFSSLAYIYKRAGMMSILQSYGTSTLFAPNNEAIAKYLHDKDSIYWATVDTDAPIETGIHSPLLEELSDSMVNVIAKTHLVPARYEKSDMKSGTELEVRNYNNYPIKTSDVYFGDGSYTINLEGQAEIVKSDEEAVNGVIHTLDYVLTPPTKNVAELLGSMPFMSIFGEALTMIGFADNLMEEHEDETYDLGNIWADSWQSTYGKTARYPKYKQTKYTVFVPTNVALKEKYGIESVEDLIVVAREWYGNEDPDNFKSEKNALNKLVRYHILPMGLTYDKLVLYNLDNGNDYKAVYGVIPGLDRYDYYTTLQGTLMKLEIPLSKGVKFDGYNSIWINPSNLEDGGTVNPKLSKFVDVRIYDTGKELVDGVDSLSADYEKYGYSILGREKSVNGQLHPINGLLIYNEEEMGSNVLYERMRFDFASLLPELMTNDVRYTSSKALGVERAAAPEYVIPNDFCKNLKVYNTETSMHYFGPYTWGCNYCGDEFIAVGRYDFGYKLPPVPEGNYELRIGYTATDIRSITQFYVIEDGRQEICGIPVDLRIKAKDPRIGWERDDKTLDIESNDRALKSRGYLKGPHYFTLYPGMATAYEPQVMDTLYNEKLTPSKDYYPARAYHGAIRHVISTRKFESGKEYWLRMKSVTDDNTKEGMHDYIELVPTSIVNDPVEGEDIY